ncbi:MAG: ATP-dependent DNA helicase [Actinomycetota bacterium]
MTAPLRIDPGEWDRWLPAPEHPQLIVGGPGTGKSEFLVRRAAHIVDGNPGAGVLLLTFSRDSATDLDTRLASAIPGSRTTIDVSTYHSFARRLLEAHADRRGWEQAPEILAGPDQRWLIAELLAGEDVAAWSAAYRSLLTTRTFADEVTDFILRCREQLIDPANLAERTQQRADWSGLPGFLERYDRTLRERHVIDYGTLLAEAAELLAEPDVANSVAVQYPWILVDEYQDTTHAQSVLLRRLAAPHGHLTAAADPYQSIYSFRGTDVGAVGRFADDFGSDQRPAERLVLTTSFRVPAAILDAAVRVSAHELPGAAGKVAAAPGAGSVEVYRFEQQVAEAEWIAAEIHRLNLEQRIPFSRMAVFTRSKTRFLLPLSRSLERRDIPHERPDRRLVDQSAVRFVFDVAAATSDADGEAETDRAVRRILLGPMFNAPLARVAEIERRRADGDGSWADVVRRGIDKGAGLADLLTDPSWANDAPAVAGLWQMWSTLPQLADLAVDPRRHQDRAAWSSFTQVLERWNDRNPRGTLLQYRRHSETEDFEASPLLSYRAEEHDRVTVSTLHQAKGLEFDVVFIADAVEGVFPDLRTRDSLLGTRHLQPQLPSDTAGYLAFRLQEERRLAYTTMTRATRRVIWTTTDSGFDAEGGTPSRFLPLAAGAATIDDAVSEPTGHHRPITAGEFEAALRRMVADPTLSPPERLGAAETLARSDDLCLRSPATFAGGLAAGPDTGVVRRPLSLSPSQATAYETCPRRYVLERKLGIGAEPSKHMEFGTLIHAILERVENAATERGDIHGTVEEAFEALDDMLAPGAFGEGPFDDAWRNRARVALENTYSLWPSAGTAVGSETELTVQRGDVQWIGRADRIEQRGDSVSIVDYKTGGLVSLDEGATSLQLGFYLIGAREDPDIGAYGEPSAAEMWFPMHPQKRSIATRSFDVANIDTIEERMAAVAEGIDIEDWTPNPSAECDRCAFRLVCPAMPEGKEAFSS